MKGAWPELDLRASRVARRRVDAGKLIQAAAALRR
jgi:hypothetical protein